MIRADKLLFEKGICKSRASAQSAISEKRAYCNGKLIHKPSELLDGDAELKVINEDKYVSRGGYKLQAALDGFNIDVKDNICVDLGASTGGFTDCLLQHGAKTVYSVDCGHGQLDLSLVNNSRVINIENCNARDINNLPDIPVCDTVVMDVSFISQTYLHKTASSLLKVGGSFITLIKPQFEAGKEHIGKGGIANFDCYDTVKSKVIDSAKEYGFELVAISESPIKGGDGNTEFIAYFIKRR